MVVNYDLPLMNDQAAEGMPDIDTYRHRIGASYPYILQCTQLSEFYSLTRSNRSIWAQGYLDKFCS